MHGDDGDDVAPVHVDESAGEYAVGGGGDGRGDGRAGGGGDDVLHGCVAALHCRSLVRLGLSLRGGEGDDGGGGEYYGYDRGDGDAGADSWPAFLVLGGGPLHYRPVA